METVHFFIEAGLLALIVFLMRDWLTGLWNRSLLYRLGYRLTRKTGGWVVMIDLDDLTGINNSGGHAAGDQALKAVAAAIKRHGGFWSFRFGGDEFAVLLPFADEAKARRVAERIRAELTVSTASFGLGQTEQEADLALDRAKKSGKNRVR